MNTDKEMSGDWRPDEKDESIFSTPPEDVVQLKKGKGDALFASPIVKNFHCELPDRDE